MSHGTLDTLVRMANQIVDYFKAQPGDRAAEEVRDHLKAFWEPRMRKQIIAHLDAGGEGLHPIAAQAVDMLREPAPADGRG